MLNTLQSLDSLPFNSKGCKVWLWANNRGYPVIVRNNKTLYVHRLLLSEYYSIDYNNPIWDAMHLCDNPSCVNLHHLMVGTRSLNSTDSVNKLRHKEAKKTSCLKGHEFSKENTKITFNGKRICLTCRRQFDKDRSSRRMTINGTRIRF